MSLLIDYASLIPRVSLYQFMSAHELPASVGDHEGVHVRLTDVLSQTKFQLTLQYACEITPTVTQHTYNISTTSPVRLLVTVSSPVTIAIYVPRSACQTFLHSGFSVGELHYSDSVPPHVFGNCGIGAATAPFACPPQTPTRVGRR